jgi:hypothetical protein
MCFADARGIPVVNEKGEPISLDEVKRILTIPYLHDLIATEVPRNPRIPHQNRGLLRSLIQDENGTAYNNFADYQAGIVNENYPVFGIDANRDVRQSLESTQVFDALINLLTRTTRSENIAVVMMHGYYSGGGVFGTYAIENGANVAHAVMVKGGKDFANAIWKFLYTSKVDDFYSDTESYPLKYAGEWNQLLYNNNRNILSIDIELSYPEFDEGRRGETGNRKYDAKKIRKTFDGVLVPGGGSYFEMLRTYSTIIAEYKERQGN